MVSTFAVLISRWLSLVQAYLAFYVIDDLHMAQSAKALVLPQKYCHYISSDVRDYLIFEECKTDLSFVIDGNRFLQLSTLAASLYL